jgi:cell division protein ZipA
VDDLRWILAIVGAVVVVATYLSGRFEREEWRRDREQGLEQSQPVYSERIEPQIEDSPKVQKVSVGLNSEDDVNKALSASEPEPTFTDREDKTKSSENEWEGAVDSAKEPLIEDEIVSVEIPAEFSQYAEERRSKSRPKTKPKVEKPFQQELGLDVESIVLVLTVLAKDENQFSGSEIKKALEDEGINHGDMDIFHYHVGDKPDAVFSVASVVEPGTFDLVAIDKYETPGLSLFCQLPNPMAGAGAFDVLLKKARSVADKLDGQLCDDKRNLLTEQATGHYRDRIMAFDREVVLARKKQE